MFGIENYAAFLVAGILLNLTPGQDSLYILGRSTAQGRQAGIASVLGIGAGSLLHTLAAALGLSYVLLHSAFAFELVRYAGAAYLVYLGIRTLLSSEKANEPSRAKTPLPALALFRTGMITNLLNPKVALFFLSFLPQFIDPGNTYGALPFLILGLTFVVTGTAWCMILAWFAGSFSNAWRDKSRNRFILEKLSGLVFVALGIRMALHSR